MNALKTLTLKLDDTRLDEKHLDELTSGLNSFDFLKELTISVSGNPLTLKSVARLLTGVSKLPRLTHLHANLRRIHALLTNKDELKNLISTLRVANLAIHN